MQNINPLADLDRHHNSVRVRGVPQGDFENTAANPLERFHVLRHSAELDQLELIAKQFLRALRKILDVLFRASEPNNRPQQRRPEILQIPTPAVYSKSTIL